MDNVCILRQKALLLYISLQCQQIIYLTWIFKEYEENSL